MTALPQEQHRNEQYFFDKATKDWLTEVLMSYGDPCLVGVPTVARERGNVRLLDIDERFADCAGWPSVDCARVAESYQGKKCPKFWPVILRAPHRLLFRVFWNWMR